MDREYDDFMDERYPNRSYGGPAMPVFSRLAIEKTAEDGLESQDTPTGPEAENSIEAESEEK